MNKTNTIYTSVQGTDVLPSICAVTIAHDLSGRLVLHAVSLQGTGVAGYTLSDYLSFLRQIAVAVQIPRDPDKLILRIDRESYGRTARVITHSAARHYADVPQEVLSAALDAYYG